MYAFTNDELRRLSAEELSLLEEKSQSGDNMAQWQMAMAILYGQANSRSIDDIAGLLTMAISQENANALLLMGYLYEHALGVSKSYAKAIEYYVKAYDIINNIKPSGKSGKSDASKALAEMEGSYNTLSPPSSSALFVSFSSCCSSYSVIGGRTKYLPSSSFVS